MANIHPLTWIVILIGAAAVAVMALFTFNKSGTTQATQQTADTTARVTGTTSTPQYGAQSPQGAGNDTAPSAYLSPVQQFQSQSLTQQVANNGSSSVYFAQLATMYGFSYNSINAVQNSADNSTVIITFKDGSVKSYPNPAYVKPVDPSAFVPQTGGAKSTEPATRKLSELTFVNTVGWVDKYGVAYTYHDDDGLYYLDLQNNTGYATLPDTPVSGAMGTLSATPIANLLNFVTGKPIVTPTTQSVKTVDNGHGVMQPSLIQNYSDGSYTIIGPVSASVSASTDTPTEVSQPPTLAQNVAAEAFAAKQAAAAQQPAVTPVLSPYQQAVNWITKNVPAAMWESPYYYYDSVHGKNYYIDQNSNAVTDGKGTIYFTPS